jgi:hypothetical protein
MDGFLESEIPESVIIKNPLNRTPYTHPEWDFQSRVNYAYRGLPANFRPLWKVRIWKGTPVAKLRTTAPDWYDMILDEFPVIPVEGPLPDPEFFDYWYTGRTGLPQGDPGVYSARPGHTALHLSGTLTYRIRITPISSGIALIPLYRFMICSMVRQRIRIMQRFVCA